MLVAVVVSVKTPQTLLYLIPLCLSSVLLSRAKRRASEQTVSYLASCAVSPYTAAVGLFVGLLKRDSVSLKRIKRSSFSARHALLFGSAAALLLLNPTGPYISLFCYAFLALFLKTERMSAIGWLLHIVLAGVSTYLTRDTGFLYVFFSVAAFLAVSPVRLVKRRTRYNQKAGS